MLSIAELVAALKAEGRIITPFREPDSINAMREPDSINARRKPQDR